MKTPAQLFFLLLTLVSTINALALPTSFEAASQLFKRKGGGGGGGRGGGGGSSSGGRSSSSSSSSSSGSRSGGVTGVGPQPRAYGSGAYYGGGSARPYSAGSRSPGGIAPVFLGVGAIGFLGAGAFAYGAYGYHYGGYYTYRNETNGNNETYPVECYCARYQQCACEQQNETEYVQSIANNQSIAQVADVNGTDTLVIDGTLPNGTVAAEEGTENAANSIRSMEMPIWALLGGVAALGVSML